MREEHIGVGPPDGPDGTGRRREVDGRDLGVGERGVKTLEQLGPLTQGGEDGRVGCGQGADPLWGDERLPAGDDGDEGGEGASGPLGHVEEAGDIRLHLDDELVVVGDGLVELTGQTQQRRQVPGQEATDEVGDDGGGQVERDEHPVQVGLDGVEDGVLGRRRGGGPDDGAWGGDAGEHPVRHCGGVLAPTGDQMSAHGPLRPRRAS